MSQRLVDISICPCRKRADMERVNISVMTYLGGYPIIDFPDKNVWVGSKYLETVIINMSMLL